MLTSLRLSPTGSLVLCEAAYGADRLPSGIIIPPAARERYPNLGLVLDIGPRVREDIRAGDWAVFDTSSSDIPKAYMDYFRITLLDGSEHLNILVDIDVEPVFRETMHRYEANRSTEDNWIQVKDIQSDEAFKFLCSDVLDWGTGPVDISKAWTIEYVNTRMVDLFTDEGIKTHYLVDESQILATIREPDANNSN